MIEIDPSTQGSGRKERFGQQAPTKRLRTRSGRGKQSTACKAVRQQRTGNAGARDRVAWAKSRCAARAAAPAPATWLRPAVSVAAEKPRQPRPFPTKAPASAWVCTRNMVRASHFGPWPRMPERRSPSGVASPARSAPRGPASARPPGRGTRSPAMRTRRRRLTSRLASRAPPPPG